MYSVLPEPLPAKPENGLVESGASKGGAPKNNANAGLHFLRSAGWPKDALRERRAVAKYGSCIRAAVIASGGSLDIVTAGLVQTAQRWERHALLCARWLRLEAETLTPDQRVLFSRETARASAERDKAVLALGLKPSHPNDPMTAWAALDALQAPQAVDDTSRADTVSNAPAAAVDPTEGSQP